MLFPEEPICRCGILYEEQITYRTIDDLSTVIAYPPRCIKCGGLITPDQREERAKHMGVILRILK